MFQLWVDYKEILVRWADMHRSGRDDPSWCILAETMEIIKQEYHMSDDLDPEKMALRFRYMWEDVLVRNSMGPLGSRSGCLLAEGCERYH